MDGSVNVSLPPYPIIILVLGTCCVFFKNHKSCQIVDHRNKITIKLPTLNCGHLKILRADKKYYQITEQNNIKRMFILEKFKMFHQYKLIYPRK